MKLAMWNQKKTALILAALMVFSSLAGCGSSPAPSSQTPSNTTSSSSEPSDKPSDAAPAEDIVVNYGITSAWDSINPYASASGSFYQNLVSEKIFDRLAYIKEAGSGITPRAALSWESTDSGKKAIFKLDPNCKFHDGTPVTAYDWEFTGQLITHPDFAFGLRSELSVFAGTDDAGVQASADALGIKALDDHTLEFTFKEVLPVEDWILLKSRYFYVLPKHLLGDLEPGQVMSADFWKAPIGSGPCTFISELAGSQLELGPHKEYQLGSPQWSKFVYTVVSPTNTVTSVMAGELDYFYGFMNLDDAQAAMSAGLDVQTSNIPSSIVVSCINNQNIPDKRVRQALNYAVDKEMIKNQTVGEYGMVGSTYILPGNEYQNTDIVWARDLEKAKQLLDEAGWDYNRTITMAIASNREAQAAIMQQNLAEIGVKLEILTVDIATMFSGLQNGTYDIGISGSTATSYPLWMEGYYDYRNATYSQITDTSYAEKQALIKSEMDHGKRVQMVKEYQTFLNDEMPLMVLYFANSFALTSERLTDINPFDTSVLNEDVYNWRFQ